MENQSVFSPRKDGTDTSSPRTPRKSVIFSPRSEDSLVEVKVNIPIETETKVQKRMRLNSKINFYENLSNQQEKKKSSLRKRVENDQNTQNTQKINPNILQQFQQKNSPSNSPTKQELEGRISQRINPNIYKTFEKSDQPQKTTANFKIQRKTTQSIEITIDKVPETPKFEEPKIEPVKEVIPIVVNTPTVETIEVKEPKEEVVEEIKKIETEEKTEVKEEITKIEEPIQENKIEIKEETKEIKVEPVKEEVVEEIKPETKTESKEEIKEEVKEPEHTTPNLKDKMIRNSFLDDMRVEIRIDSPFFAPNDKVEERNIKIIATEIKEESKLLQEGAEKDTEGIVIVTDDKEIPYVEEEYTKDEVNEEIKEEIKPKIEETVIEQTNTEIKKDELKEEQPVKPDSPKQKEETIVPVAETITIDIQPDVKTEPVIVTETKKDPPTSEKIISSNLSFVNRPSDTIKEPKIEHKRTRSNNTILQTQSSPVIPTIIIPNTDKENTEEKTLAPTSMSKDLSFVKIGTNNESFSKKAVLLEGPTSPRKSILKVLGVTRLIRNVVSKNKLRYQEDGFDLDLSYITKNIIAMGYPSSGLESTIRNPVGEVLKLLERKHKDNYKIYNLCSEKQYDPGTFFSRVENFGFNDHHPPPFVLLRPICENIKRWLEIKDKVAVLHCKAGKGRTGTVIACFLLHVGLFETAKDALDYFGTKRTKDGKGVTIPSQIRYVHYYERCLKNGFPKQDKKLTLTEIKWSCCPKEGCRPTFTVQYLGQVIFDFEEHVQELKRFESDVHMKAISFSVGQLAVKGDILFTFQDLDSKKKKYFHFWLNTNMIDDKKVLLKRNEIDGGVRKDKKFKNFPADFAICVKFEE